MAKKSGEENTLSWLFQNQPELNDAIDNLVTELIKFKTSAPTDRLPGKQEDKFTQEYKNAELGKSKGEQYILGLAKAMGYEHPHDCVDLAPMKDRYRAREKFNLASRNAHDFGRSRLYLYEPGDRDSFYKVLGSKTKDGVIKNIQCKGVKVVDGSLSDYLEKARKSGFSGTINLDLEIDLGKGRIGYYEVQLMPYDYIQVDKHSHALYDMIRILDEIPDSFKTKGVERLEDILVMANASFFIEHGERTGFIVLREDAKIRITEQDLHSANDILTRLRDKLDDWVKTQSAGKKRSSRPSSKLQWAKDASEALSFAKTSILNAYYSKYNTAKPQSGLTNNHDR